MQHNPTNWFPTKILSSTHADHENTGTYLRNVEPDTATPFFDQNTGTSIECYIDSIAVIDGIEYSIGCPCDYAVALCYFDENDQLIPIDAVDDAALMDEIFPIAESIVEEEFGEELCLMKTPQTLTLSGELDLDEPEEGDDDDETEDDEEEVEVLMSFEHEGAEFSLVRLLDPVLLVSKIDDDPLKRVLLSVDESDKVLPILEEMILENQEEL